MAGTGSYLPGRPISIDEVDRVLGELTEAPKKIQDWMQRMKMLMKELLEVESYHYAIDPETRQFTDDNISMSVKAAQSALEMAGIEAPGHRIHRLRQRPHGPDAHPFRQDPGSAGD